jgi:hypothetical protein
MNLQQIIDFTRYRLNNYEQPYYWVDAELVYYCNEVMNQMACDGRLIEDSMTASCCEIHTAVDVLDYALSDSVVFVRSAKIVTEELMTLDTLPSTAWAAGDTITGGTSAVTSKVVSKLTDYTYIIENRTGAYTLGETLSNGTYSAHQSATYPTIKDYKGRNVSKETFANMEARYGGSGWRTQDNKEPLKYILDYNEGYITLYPKPDDIYLLRLSVCRYPITAMTTASMSAQIPEIPAKYHDTIINGICAMAYLKGGDNTYNEKRTALFMALYKKGLSDIKRRNNIFQDVGATIAPARGFI